MRIVLDSNILLAALGTRGLCEALLEVCLASHELYLSTPILDELEQHLSGKFKMTPARTSEILHFLRTEFTLVRSLAVAPGACRDPNDLMVLGTALAAQADCLVSGDQDLLILRQYQGVLILSPRALYDRLK